MKNRLQEIAYQINAAVKRNPVEVFLSVLFCCIGFYQVNNKTDSLLMVLLYSPVLYMVTYTLNTLCKRGWSRFMYYASPLLTIPCLWIKPIHYFPTNLFVSIIVVQLIYLALFRFADNEQFMKKTIAYIIALFSAFLLSGVFLGLSFSIIASVQYIFEIWRDSEDMMLYAATISVFAVMPLLFLMFNRDRDIVVTNNKIFDIMLNYLLSPALLIYTAIIYIYLIKIVALWSLPKGDVAYIVVIFSAMLFLLKGFQTFLGKRNYDWFYNHASLIALPALAMYWAGSLYRINEYGFTEARVYLVVVGLALTGIAMMFLNKRTGKYLYASWLTISLLSVVTYIPGITASSIEHRSQSTRTANGENIENKIVEISRAYDLPVDVESFKSLESLGYATRLDTQNDTLRLFDRHDTLLFEKSFADFWSDQLSKVGLQRGDSIPASLYPELLKLDMENSRLIFNRIVIEQDSISYLHGDYYLTR